MRITALYDALAALVPTPVVEFLDIVDALLDESALKNYYLLPSVRGDLLFKLERMTEAGVEFERAASQTQNARDRAFLLGRVSVCRNAVLSKGNI